MSSRARLRELLASLTASWQTLVVVLTPVLLCPLVFPYQQTSPESRFAFVVLLMATYWITEAVPLPVTSLLPITLCPLLGVASSKLMCKAFFGDVTFILIGGIIVAIAVEESQLHKRLAIRTLMFIGVEPRRLLLGITLTTAFLSMWINNMAATAMMMPITRALVAKLFQANKRSQQEATSRTDDASQNSKLKSSQPEELVVGTSTDSLSFKAPPTTYVTKPGDAPAAVSGGQTYMEMVELDTYAELDVSSTEVSNGNVSFGPHRTSTELVAEQEQTQDTRGQEHQEENEDDLLNRMDGESRDCLKAFSLTVCYAANIGGMSTLTGTSPNLVLGRLAADLPVEWSTVTFTSWLAFSLPVSLFILIGCYLTMIVFMFGFRRALLCRSLVTREEAKLAEDTIRQEYRNLGGMKFSEWIVLFHFLLLVALWLSRDPGSGTGWASLFNDRFVSDGTPALAIAISLFIFPNQRPNVLFFRKKGDSSVPRSTPSILNWKQTSLKFPWGGIFLIGGGFALSEASKVSGFSTLIADKLMFIQVLPLWTASAVVTLLTSLLTEITSNTVVVVLLLPILRDIAIVLQVNPLFLMVPTTLASSLAFMLPIATPPNALVFAYGNLKTVDMIKAGVILNLVGIATIAVAINSWGYPIFHLQTFHNLTTLPVNLVAMTSSTPTNMTRWL